VHDLLIVPPVAKKNVNFNIGDSAKRMRVKNYQIMNSEIVFSMNEFHIEIFSHGD
jgi:hypothetical protein